MRRLLAWLIVVVVLALGGLAARDYVRRHPQDVPWTRLRLHDPPGLFTARKLVALGDEPAQCRATLAEGGAGDLPASPKSSGTDCGYADGMRLTGDGRTVDFAPAGLITSCPVAAALVLFERDVLQPAAQRHFGERVAIIDHAGSYSCRRMYGRTEGAFSEHATADALDIVGFRLADGTRISVARDWESGGAKGRFLRDVRDGSCRLFATILSPDYNAAHADHLHLDQAQRGKMGWSLCR
jgi:hypothetical protein